MYGSEDFFEGKGFVGLYFFGKYIRCFLFWEKYVWGLCSFF